MPQHTVPLGHSSVPVLPMQSSTVDPAPPSTAPVHEPHVSLLAVGL